MGIVESFRCYGSQCYTPQNPRPLVEFELFRVSARNRVIVEFVRVVLYRPGSPGPARWLSGGKSFCKWFVWSGLFAV